MRSFVLAESLFVQSSTVFPKSGDSIDVQPLFVEWMNEVMLLTILELMKLKLQGSAKVAQPVNQNQKSNPCEARPSLSPAKAASSLLGTS